VVDRHIPNGKQQDKFRSTANRPGDDTSGNDRQSVSGNDRLLNYFISDGSGCQKLIGEQWKYGQTVFNICE
jgi:hypothetical protein